MPNPYKLKTEGTKKYLLIDYRESSYGPSIADYPQAMAEVIQYLGKTDADILVLAEVYERVYDEGQTKMLKEIANLLQSFRTRGVWSPTALGGEACSDYLSQRHDLVVNVASDLLFTDPIRAYLKCLEAIKAEKERLPGLPPEVQKCTQTYVLTLEFLRASLESTELIQRMKSYIRKLKKLPPGRGFYHTLFEAQLKPSFIGSRLLFKVPEQIELLDQYNVKGATVTIYKHPEKIEYLYYINPPEYALTPEQFFLMSKTKEIVSTYHPEGLEFTELATSKDYFMRVYETTISDLARENNIPITPTEVKDLAEIVARYTIGFGMMGLVLSDERLTDIYIDAPLGLKPVYVVHSEYGPCQTNIFFSEDEANSVVSRFRSMSGRPFDEAHSVLDFDLQEYHTRTATIGPPLSPDGMAFALRIHKGTPWTLPQFIDVKMVTKEVAGLESFLVDAQASSLIVGSRGSGKCLEGDTLIQLADGRLKPIKELVEENLSNPQSIEGEDGIVSDCSGVEIITMSPDQEMRRAPVAKVWRRSAPEELLRITFASGKQITTTPEHPFFTVNDSAIVHRRADQLSLNEFVATPRILPVIANACEDPDVFDLSAYETGCSAGRGFRLTGCMQQVRTDLTQLMQETNMKQAAMQMGITYKRLLNIKNGVRQAVSLDELKRISDHLGKDVTRYLSSVDRVMFSNSCHIINHSAAFAPLNEDYARFLGLLLGDGHVDELEVTFTNTDSALLNDFCDVGYRVFGVRPHIVRPKERVTFAQLASRGASRILSNRFDIPLGRKARIQSIPKEVLAAPDNIVASFISGYFDCDSGVHVKKCEIELSTASKSVAEQMQYLLLRFGILSSLAVKRVNGVDYYRLFVHSEACALFRDSIGFTHQKKKASLDQALRDRTFNSNVDVVPDIWSLLKRSKADAGSNIKMPSDQHNIGRKKLQRLADSFAEANPGSEAVRLLNEFAYSDIFWDRVTDVERVKPKEKYVYDLTVDGTHSFVANGVIAHNTSMMMALMLEILPSLRIITIEDTLELPVEYMRGVGYNICRLKTRSAISVGAITSEVSPEDALRTALRLGDSVLICGEVRSKEALVLYEAMRVGAVGNVVMGTVHGESAYSVWDRVVNDLGVPNTSFKATDVCIVQAPIRFKGGLKKHRRVVEVTEVGKEWYEDPGREGGLLNLMEYDATKDTQVLIKDNIMNESTFFKKLTKRRGMGIDDIWTDITYRGETKQFLVDMKRQYDIPDLLEAKYTVRCNDKYLLMQEQSREEVGAVDHPKVFEAWKDWVREGFVKELVSRRAALAKVKPKEEGK
ncbi:MAG: Flp pilus assembly complex ATPase component TadA [Candidatus Diapherotrites archaeon]|nr:Flp pilus assembly complex ATPase component TadA [Candidatus Diapherotrites archaeon]